MSQSQGDKTEEIENFFGVYLLLSQNLRYKGRTYVGFTVDPIRRLKQHNGGKTKFCAADLTLTVSHF